MVPYDQSRLLEVIFIIILLNIWPMLTLSSVMVKIAHI